MNEMNGHIITSPYAAENRRAFEGVASIYDGPFGNNTLIQRMRTVVWKEIVNRTSPGANVLDLGCGTGIDAIHLAGLGYKVWATDQAANMVEMTRKSVSNHGMTGRVNVQQLDIHELANEIDNSFDVIYSNFGALNCVTDVQKLAEDCAGLLHPGGLLITNVMGKYCPWETGYYLLLGHPRRAFFRWSRKFRSVPLGKERVWTKYYRPAQWFRSFEKYFELLSYRAMSLVMPPPYLKPWVTRHPKLFGILDRWDEQLSASHVFRNFGDHFLMTLRLK